MKRIIELSENDYMVLKEEGVQNHLELADTIIEHSAVYEEKHQGGWIPISERLPDKSGLYLISVDDLVTVANFTGTYFMRRGGYVEVDAWQPLFEPYKPYKKGGVE